MYAESYGTRTVLVWYPEASARGKLLITPNFKILVVFLELHTRLHHFMILVQIYNLGILSHSGRSK